MLQGRRPDLHPAGPADARMRDVPVAADLVGRVDDHHPLLHLVRQHPGALAQHGGLDDPRAAQQQDALATDDHVLDDVDGAGDGAAHPAGHPHDLAVPIADGGDTVQGSLDAGPVVIPERSDAGGHELKILGGDRGVAQDHLFLGEARFGLAAEVQHDLQQVAEIRQLVDRAIQVRWQRLEQEVQLVGVRPHQAVLGSKH